MISILKFYRFQKFYDSLDKYRCFVVPTNFVVSGGGLYNQLVFLFFLFWPIDIFIVQDCVGSGITRKLIKRIKRRFSNQKDFSEFRFFQGLSEV